MSTHTHLDLVDLNDGHHPELAGSASYRFSDDGKTVSLQIERITNPRDALNVSGTLAFELWALTTPYEGGDFFGEALAGVAIGTLGGQQSWADLRYELPLTLPATGTWTIVLMLREWTGIGYTTRAFINFATPVTLPLVTAAAPVAPEPVTSPMVTPPAAPVAPATLPRAKSPKAGKPAKATKADPVPPPTVSINHATFTEIASLPGMTGLIAKGIVARRPFRSIDELLDVRGVGAKLLTKIRGQLRVD